MMMTIMGMLYLWLARVTTLSLKNWQVRIYINDPDDDDHHHNNNNTKAGF